MPPSESAPTTVAENRSSTALATRIAQLVVEVLNGRRNASSVRENLTGPAYMWLATRQRTAHVETRRYWLHSVHACLTSCETVEACWVIHSADRVRAVVSRIERRQNTWRCTWLRLVENA